MFLNAHRCLEEGVEPQSERAWLFKIAEHVVMYRRRTISRRARVEFPIDINSLADLVVAPGREVPAELHALPEALARIPEAQQRAIVLREWYGLSYREVAAELGLSASAAETLIFRARRRLAQELGGPAPTLRRRRPLGFVSPLASLKWLLGGGTTLKALVGVTSVAVLAVGSARVVLQRQSAPLAAAAAPERVLVLVPPAAHAPRHAVRLRASVAAGLPARKARARAPQDPTPAAAAPAPAPVVADPAETAATPDPATATDPDPATDPAPTPTPAAPAPSVEDRSPAAVEPTPAPEEELAVVTDVAAAQPPAVDLAAGDPVDTTASDPGKSGDPHGPNEMAAAGQAQRSEQVPATAAVPGNQVHGAGPQNGNAGKHNGNAIPQPPNVGVPDLSALPAATGSDSQVPAAATDPTTQPGNSGGGGQPPAQAQGVPAAPAAHEPSPPHGQGGGPAEQDPSDLAPAVAV